MEAEKSTETQTSGADLESFAFTLALVPTYAQIYVHWVELGAVGEAVSYHMNVTDIYVMRTKQSVNSLRQAIHHILNWGLFQRKKEIFEIYATVMKVQQEDDSGEEEDPFPF